MHKQITYSSEPKVIGVKNGVYQVELKLDGLNLNKDFSKIVSILTEPNDFIKNQHKVFDFDLGEIEGTLLKKAKLTDFMVFTPFLFGIKYLISEQIVDCLLDLRVAKEEFRLFPVKLSGIDEQYYLLFVPWIPNTAVDFSNSLIYPSIELLDERKSYYEINSYEAYQQLIKANPLVVYEKVTLPKDYMGRDLISVQGIANLFFSERLTDKLNSIHATSFILPRNQVVLSFSEADAEVNFI